MPTKDPMTWAALWEALPDPIRAAVVGALVALIRVMYDGSEPSIRHDQPPKIQPH